MKIILRHATKHQLMIGAALLSTVTHASMANNGIVHSTVATTPAVTFVSLGGGAGNNHTGGGEASSDDDDIEEEDTASEDEEYDDKWFDDETTPEHVSGDEYANGFMSSSSAAAPSGEETNTVPVVLDDADSSKPLETLKKLQQMLDETDYMTTRSRGEEKKGSKRRVLQDHVEQASLQQQQHQPLPQTAYLPPPLPEYQQNIALEEAGLSPPSLPEYLPQDDFGGSKPNDESSDTRQQVHQNHEVTPPPLPESPQSNEEQPRQETLPPQYQYPVPPFPEKSQAATKQPQQEEAQIQPLWTSKDRSKYKKMRQMQRRAEEERRRLELQLNQPSSSDDEEGGTTDDGLGYNLPNLPIYMSDAEGEGSDSGEHLTSSSATNQQTGYQPPPPPRQDSYPQWQRQDNYLPPQYQQQPPSQQSQQQQYTYTQYPPRPPPDQLQPPPYGYPNAYPPGYPPPYPYPQYGAQQQQQQLTPEQQQIMAAQYAAAWSSYYPPSSGFRTPQGHVHAANKFNHPFTQPFEYPKPDQAQVQPMPDQQELVVKPEVPTSLAEASARINFDSIQKTMLLGVCVALVSYCAVSPRNLPLVQYNIRFYENLRLVGLATIAPIANFLLVCDARENDINSVITSFYTSFTVGYMVAFMLEIILTTVIRLGVFAFWEPNIFKLSPKVPRLVLPWVVRENKYKPKRITLFAADFLSSCVAGPIVEEYMKLKILQLSVRLPRNFQWQTKMSLQGKKTKKRRKRRVAEAVGGEEVININSYVTHMLAVSLGLKLCDSARRILMYTKVSQPNKSFYAFCRGMFPIHELCGTMTALDLAKRDVLGVDMPIWKLLFPAVFIHGMANFRGMKPIFKWNAATPWSEMQLSPFNAADDSTLPQLLNKGFAKLMWLVILGRVLGYCIKNYYLISRQARKRTTTYAGKQAAFSAELAAAEMLKKTKDKK